MTYLKCMRRTRVCWRASAALVATIAAACAGGPTAPGEPAALHVFPQTIMIMEGRAVPEVLTIAVGEQVSFMNHDRTPYTVAAGRGPSGNACPELGAIGVLGSGDTRTTEAFKAATTCEFQVSREQQPLTTGRIIVR